MEMASWPHRARIALECVGRVFPEMPDIVFSYLYQECGRCERLTSSILSQDCTSFHDREIGEVSWIPEFDRLCVQCLFKRVRQRFVGMHLNDPHSHYLRMEVLHEPHFPGDYEVSQEDGMYGVLATPRSHSPRRIVRQGSYHSYHSYPGSPKCTITMCLFREY